MFLFWVMSNWVFEGWACVYEQKNPKYCVYCVEKKKDENKKKRPAGQIRPVPFQSVGRVRWVIQVEIFLQVENINSLYQKLWNMRINSTDPIHFAISRNMCGLTDEKKKEKCVIRFQNKRKKEKCVIGRKEKEFAIWFITMQLREGWNNKYMVVFLLI